MQMALAWLHAAGFTHIGAKLLELVALITATAPPTRRTARWLTSIRLHEPYKQGKASPLHHKLQHQRTRSLSMSTTFTRAALLSTALIASGAVFAQQTNPQQPLIEGVPAQAAPSPHMGSAFSRTEVRGEARSANAAGEADKGGLVGPDLGQPNASGQRRHMLSRSEVQAQVRGQTDRIGGEADDLGRVSAM